MKTKQEITYRAGYKYQLENAYIHQLSYVFPDVAYEYETDYLWLGLDKKLIVKKGYAWDGPSGPTIDTKNFMRGSLVHDALYQLMRLGYLDKNICRILADQELYRICSEDEMSWVRTRMMYYSLRVFGNPAARHNAENPIIEAP